MVTAVLVIAHRLIGGGSGRCRLALLCVLALSIALTLPSAALTPVDTQRLLPSAGPYADGNARAAATRSPSFRIDAPAHVAVGVPFDLTLIAQDVSDLAGYETVLRFDSSLAHFDGLAQRHNDVQRAGRDISPLTAIEMPNAVAFGFVSCPTGDCVAASGPRQSRGANGTLTLARVSLVADRPGLLPLQFDPPLVVDAVGTRVPVLLRTPTLWIQVGAGTGSARHVTPARPSRPEARPSSTPGPFTQSGNQRVTYTDLMEAELAWETTHLQDAPCGSLVEPRLDVNHDGCLDVADLQLIAAQLSPPAPRAPAGAAQPTTSFTFTVTSTSNQWDANPGDGMCATPAGDCSLAAAIQEASLAAGPSTIAFNIPGSGVHTIQLDGHLPPLQNPTWPITIDGYTQPGATPNTDLLVDNARLLIQVVGTGEANFECFTITSAGNLVRGLNVYQCNRDFWIYGSGALNNTLAGNIIGTDLVGSYRAAALTLPGHGVHIEQGAAQTHVGGPSAAERNVISGSARTGIGIWHEQTDGIVVLNNIIGLSPDGTRAVGNQKHGIDLNYGTKNDIIGGTRPFQRNVSSANGDRGIEVSHSTTTTNNSIVGNYIGTDVTGTRGPAGFGNTTVGLTIEEDVTNNVFSDNVIGNNRVGGVEITGTLTTGNHLFNNRIGIGVDGSPIPNLDYGVLADGRQALVGPGNIIAYNANVGIQLKDVQPTPLDNTFTQNSIFSNGTRRGGLGIDIAPLGVNQNDQYPHTGPNQRLNFPVLTSATPTQVSGTACVTCTVEVFVADGGAGTYGQGKTFVGSGGVKSDGTFTVAVSAVQAGSYLTATATDAMGNTSEFGLNLLVPGSTIYAADTFSRVLARTWGSADVGGSYALSGASADYNVTGTAGTMNISVPNGARAALLGGVSALNVDGRVRVQTNKAATGGGQYVRLVARSSATGSEYRGQLRVASTGSVYLQALKSVTNVITGLSPEVQAPGVLATPNTYLWLRMQVTGINPSTVRLKAWADGQAEPANWQYMATDVEPKLQAPGGVGLRTYLSSTTTNAPVLFTFDDLQVASATGP